MIRRGFGRTTLERGMIRTLVNAIFKFFTKTLHKVNFFKFYLKKHYLLERKRKIVRFFFIM